jgi:hypothetical protein
MRLANDKSGRVPFSIVAVVILVGSVATGAYMQQVSNDQNERTGRSAGTDPAAVIPELRFGLEEIAARCIDAAVELQTAPDADEGCQGLWRVEQNFRRYFAEQVRRDWGLKHFERYCLTAEAGESTLELAPLPMSIRAINRLGMPVNMTAPAGFRAAGAVNFTFTLEGGQKLQKTVGFELSKASWYPLALFQANRLRRDGMNEGLLELLFKEMFRGYLDTDFERMLSKRNEARQNDEKSTVTVGSLWKKRNFDEPGLNAVLLAMNIEEQALWGQSGCVPFNYYINLTRARPLDLSSAMDYPNGVFVGVTAFDGGRDGGLKLDLGPFFRGITAFPADMKGPGAERYNFSLGSFWPELPQPEFRTVSFAGEEERVDVYMLEVTVNGIYRLLVGPDEGHRLRLDIPVHLQFTIDRQYLETNRPWSEEGRHHCEIEDLELFETEYAGLYCRASGLELDLSNSTGVRLRELPDGSSLDVSLDGDYLGTFRRGEVGPKGLGLTNVPSGPHQVAVVWNGGFADGTELGSGTVQLNGTDATLRITAGPESDTSLFWTYALAYLRDTPPNLRLARLVEFLSIQAGHPVPDGAGSTTMGPAGNAPHMLSWLAGIEGTLAANGGDVHLSGPAGAAMLKGALDTVKVVREALKFMEKVESTVDSYNKLHPAAPASADPSISYANKNGAESLSCSAKGAFGKESLSLERPANGAGWKVSGSGAVPAGRTGGPGLLSFGAAMDIGVAVTMVVSAYFKHVRYESTDGTTSFAETLDLGLDCTKVVLQVSKLMVKHVFPSAVDKLGGGANFASKVSGGIGVIIAVFSLLQLIYEENQKFRGDIETWNALFTGLDLETITFYLSIGGLVLGIIHILLLCAGLTAYVPVVSALLAVVALVLVVSLMVFNWNAFTTFVTGTLSDSDRDKMANAIEGTLRQSARTVSQLNEYPADAEMLSARQARGAASFMSGMASIVGDPGLSFELQNLSRHQFDLAWAREHQARAVRSLRFFNIALWKQANEFGGAGYTNYHWKEEQKWDGKILVTRPGMERGNLAVGDTRSFLLGLNASSLEKTKIDFEISGRVVVERLALWMDPLARIGDQVKLWQKRLAASQEMKVYLSGVNGVRRQHDWGLLKVKLSPTYTTCTVLLSTGEQFDFQDEGTGGRATVLQKTITRSDRPVYIYLEKGTYSIEFSQQKPDLFLKDKRGTVKVVDLYSTAFGQRTIDIRPEPDPVYFQICNEYNGSLKVRAAVYDQEGSVVGALGTVYEYTNTTKMSGRVYINDQWVPGFCFDGTLFGLNHDQANSLTLHIRFTVELDRENDGIYEMTMTKNVYTNDIYNDLKVRMDADGNKENDQLGYYLTVLNEPFWQKYGEDEEGNDLLRGQYIKWGKID